MPTYVYRRPDGTTFEAFQRISDDALTEDPETGVPVVRVISGGAGLQFKGDGFYLTDYARKGGETASGSKEETATSSSDSNGSGSDAGTKTESTASSPPSSKDD